MESQVRARAAALFDALGHPGRIAIVELLADQPLSVGDVADRLGLPQSSASQQLHALLRVGLLAVSPEANRRVYRIRGPRVAKLLELVEEFCLVQGLIGEPEPE